MPPGSWDICGTWSCRGPSARALAADAFYVAYRIPNLLRELLAEGSMSAAFIPVFTETLTKESKESARHLANAVFARLLRAPCRPDRLSGSLFAPSIVKADRIGVGVLKAGLPRQVPPRRDAHQTHVPLSAVHRHRGACHGHARTRSGQFLAPALSPVMLNIMTISARGPQPSVPVRARSWASPSAWSWEACSSS